jgi:hypothetical protein
MKRFACFFLSATLLFCAGCQSVKESSKASKFMPEINPYSRTVGSSQTVTLYFPITGESYLSSYKTTVDVKTSAGETLQNALIRELVSGPAQGLSMDAVFSNNLRSILAQTNGNLLTIVLSKELLNISESTPVDTAIKKQLIIYAIVDTLTGNGDITQVQILIGDDSGQATAPVRSQVGFSDTNADTKLGALGFSAAYLLTPTAAAQIMFDADKSKDAERMLRFLGGTVSIPSLAALKSKLQNAKTLIIDDNIANIQMSVDNQQATVYVDITYQRQDGSVKQVLNQPIAMVWDRSVWKVDYQSVEPLLFP